MFSKNYRRELKQRRIKHSLIIVCIIVLVGGVVISYDKGSVYVKNHLMKYGNNSEMSDTGKSKDETVPVVDNLEVEEDANEQENLSTFEAKLSSGKSIVITLKEEENKKLVEKVESVEGIKSSISPSKEKVLILDKETQDIYIVDNLETITAITNSEYVATTNEVFTKETVLQYNKDYKWVDSAEFIDDTYVAYSSELPWINEEGYKYLWIVNTADNNHRGYFSITGKEMAFGPIIDEGITVLVDNREVVVNAQGKIINDVKSR